MLTNFFQMIAIFVIPAALCFVFGRVVGDIRQGWAVLAAMTLIFIVAVVAVTHYEQLGNPRITALGVDASAGIKERFAELRGLCWTQLRAFDP